MEKPPRLVIPAVPYTREYQYVHRELKDMERAIDDEGSEDEAPLPVTAGRVPSVELVLSFAHRATGTIPLTNRIRRAFPHADAPRTHITFIDGRSRERMPGWVMHEDRYAWGLREWYDEHLIWAGAYVRLESTENPSESQRNRCFSGSEAPHRWSCSETQRPFGFPKPEGSNITRNGLKTRLPYDIIAPVPDMLTPLSTPL